MKEHDEIIIQTISKGIVLEETKHVVISDEAGLYVVRKGFNLYLKDVHDSNNIVLVNNNCI